MATKRKQIHIKKDTSWKCTLDKRVNKITPIQDFMIPAGRLSKHMNTFEHVYTWKPTHKYIHICVKPNTSRAVISVFQRLIQQMLPPQSKFEDSNLLCCCILLYQGLCPLLPPSPPLGMVAIRLYKIAQTKAVLACSTRQVDVVRRVYVWGKLLTISTGANENGMNGAAFSQ